MIGLIGYNFFGDGNSLDPTPTNVYNVNNSKLRNGIFRHFTLTSDNLDDSDIPPANWIAGMILNAGFNNSLSGGSLQDIVGNVVGYKVKRRKVGDFDWVTIAQNTSIASLDELTFTLTDHLARCLTEYEYAFVPIISGGSGIYNEGTYIVKSIISKFDGVFVCDDDNIYKFDGSVQFGNTDTTQKLGIYEPLGRKYPVIVSNGNISYQTGQATGLVLNENYKPGQPLDRKAIVEKRRLFVDFLNNRRPKILKDWNGQAWLIQVTTNPSISYTDGSGIGLGSVTFGWTEVGDVDDKQDLYDNGMIQSAD